MDGIRAAQDRMLGKREEFHMGKTMFTAIRDQRIRHFPIAVK